MFPPFQAWKGKGDKTVLPELMWAGAIEKLWLWRGEAKAMDLVQSWILSPLTFQFPASPLIAEPN